MGASAPVGGMMKAEIVVMNNPAWGFPAGSDIDVGLNGVPFVIQEGAKVKVPVGVLENLENAVVRIVRTNKETGQILFDENREQLHDIHKRYVVQVLTDPRKRRISPNKTVGKTENALKALEERVEEDKEAAEEIEDEKPDEVVVRKGLLGKIFDSEKS